MSAVPATVPSPAPATIPPPSEVFVQLQSLMTSIPTMNSEPAVVQLIHGRFKLALGGVRAYDDDLTKIREEGHFHYSAEDHKQVIAQEQEEWEKWYNENLIKYVPELQPTTPKKVEEQ